MNCVYVHDDKNVAFLCVHHLSPLQASMKNERKSTALNKSISVEWYATDIA